MDGKRAMRVKDESRRTPRQRGLMIARCLLVSVGSLASSVDVVNPQPGPGPSPNTTATMRPGGGHKVRVRHPDQSQNTMDRNE